MTDDRPGPDDLQGSIDEAIAELRDGRTRGFYLVTSDGYVFTEVFHDLTPDEWEIDTGLENVSRVLLLGYAVHSLLVDNDAKTKDVLLGLYHASKIFSSDPKHHVKDYRKERDGK